jgi:hypothetical protein
MLNAVLSIYLLILFIANINYYSKLSLCLRIIFPTILVNSAYLLFGLKEFELLYRFNIIVQYILLSYGLIIFDIYNPMYAIIENTIVISSVVLEYFTFKNQNIYYNIMTALMIANILKILFLLSKITWDNNQTLQSRFNRFQNYNPGNTVNIFANYVNRTNPNLILLMVCYIFVNYYLALNFTENLFLAHSFLNSYIMVVLIQRYQVIYYPETIRTIYQNSAEGSCFPIDDLLFPRVDRIYN